MKRLWTFLAEFFLVSVIVCIAFMLDAQNPGTKRWEFLTDSYIYSSPAIGIDGTIYVWSYYKTLYALNPEGTKKWEFSTGGYVFTSLYTSPAIGNDGTIYLGSDDKKLYAIKSDGTKKWTFLTGGNINSTPAIGSDGTIYTGSFDNKLYAINPEGTKKWEFLTGDAIYSSPVIGNNGIIYVGSNDNKLYAINPNGTKKWDFSTGDDIRSVPSIGGDGMIYVGSNDKKLYAIKPDGTKKWEFLTANSIYSSPAISNAGTIYVGSYDKKLYAINPDGTKKWEFLTGSSIYSSPAIGSDGTIYIGTSDFKLYAINPDGTKKWEFLTENYIFSSPAIAADGIIYVGSYDKKLYAIYSESKGLASGPWPKFHNNNLNTGNSSEIVCKNNFFASFLGNNQTLSFDLDFSCVNKKIEITALNLDNNRFKLNRSLPIIFEESKSRFTLPFTLSNAGTDLHNLSYQLTYKMDGDTKVYTDSLKLATIINTNSELSLIGKRAIEAYNLSVDSNQVARLNNQGVIFRILGYYDLAKNIFDQAVGIAINQQFGFTGIKMNQGVVQSDKKNINNATTIYNDAMSDVADKKDVSALAPQITYNQAWELYGKADYTGAELLALQTLNHDKANAWLKAKAAALLGAIKYSKGDKNGAVEAFQMAYSLDLTGPVGTMAKENMQLITSTDDLQYKEDFLVYPQPAIDFVVVECYRVLKQNVTMSLYD